MINNADNPTREQTYHRAKIKTGVLTFHRCINYGSYWQARCLADGLRARGHEATLLDHHSQRVNRLEWKCAFRPTLPTPVPKSDHPHYRRKIEKFFAAFDALPLSPSFPLDDPTQMPACDLVVVGSDEVWNLRHPWYAGCPLFYGEGVRAACLASYAASCGNYPASDGLEPVWAARLRRFDAISVRDDNARALIQNALGFEPALVLDPCLQFPQFPARPEGDWEGPNRPFVAVYGHNCTGEFSGQARRWAHSRGLPLVSIGYRNEWADTQWLGAGPHDFAQCMARAEAVVTNFFHGCVFALNNAKPFVCETSAYRSAKVQGLMATVGGAQHLVGSSTAPETFDALLDAPLDPAIHDRITALRRRSEMFLETMEGLAGAGTPNDGAATGGPRVDDANTGKARA